MNPTRIDGDRPRKQPFFNRQKKRKKEEEVEVERDRFSRDADVQNIRMMVNERTEAVAKSLVNRGQFRESGESPKLLLSKYMYRVSHGNCPKASHYFGRFKASCQKKKKKQRKKLGSLYRCETPCTFLYCCTM